MADGRSQPSRQMALKQPIAGSPARVPCVDGISYFDDIPYWENVPFSDDLGVVRVEMTEKVFWTLSMPNSDYNHSWFWVNDVSYSTWYFILRPIIFIRILFFQQEALCPTQF